MSNVLRVTYSDTISLQKLLFLIQLLVFFRGKAMENYPQELAQDAVCQSHTGHMTGLWFLPTQPLRLNTNERMNELIFFSLVRSNAHCVSFSLYSAYNNNVTGYSLLLSEKYILNS